MPACLQARPAAAAFWDAHAQQLVAAGRLRSDLADTFAILCQLHADCLALAEQLAAEGWVTATDKGQAASPVAKLLRDSRRDYVALAREFGMTAASDARLPQDATDGKKETDPEAALLKRLAVRSA
jgi:P27 family predicted phage terminase small subunit